MLPSLISSRPAIIRKVVDLPHPDGPTRTTNSSSSITRLALLTATTLPYRFVTFSKTTLAKAPTPFVPRNVLPRWTLYHSARVRSYPPWQRELSQLDNARRAPPTRPFQR